MTRDHRRKKAGRAHAAATGRTYLDADTSLRASRSGTAVLAARLRDDLVAALEAAGWPVVVEHTPQFHALPVYAGPAVVHVARTAEPSSASTGDEHPDDPDVFDLDAPLRVTVWVPLTVEYSEELKRAVGVDAHEIPADRPAAEIVAEIDRVVAEARRRDLADTVAERADAARNRRRILAAAAALIAERGVAAVSIDDVAAAAGVGRMTVYRRFGDKSGLARTLLAEAESALQQQILRGEPPLGPGAEPSERLGAFVEAYLRLCDTHLDLVRLAEHAVAAHRYRYGVYRLWHTHVRLLLAAAGAADPDLRADLLLAGLVGDLLAHRRHERGDTLAEIITGVRHAAAALARP